MDERKERTATPGFLDRIASHRSPARVRLNARMRKVMSLYLPTANDTLLNREIDWLLDTISHELLADEGLRGTTGPNRGGRALIVIGEAGAGKSRALKRMFETRPEFEGFGEPGCPVLSVVAPSPFTLSALGNEIAQKLGYFSRRNLRQSEVWPLIRGLMQEWGVRILHIDEAQHGDQISNSHVAQEIESTMSG